MKILTRLLVGALAVVLVAYLGVLAYVYVNQRSLQYFPSGELTDLAAAAIPAAEAVALPTGANGWYAPPREGLPTILYYKGNSGSFSAEYERYAQWVSEGYGFFAFDYRGFPASPGDISQAAILEDSQGAYDYVAARGDPIVIWGRSLGSGPATYIASVNDAEALLLETPFLSAVTVAGERYPFLPVRLLMSDQFPVSEWIADVAEPVYVAHGTADTVIGVSNGERVYAAAPNPAELWIEPDGTHSDLWQRGLWPRARAFFEAAMARAS